ncbi:hypothetical protein BH23ACT12_BH23ACT12_02360 [soil metagenome]
MDTPTKYWFKRWRYGWGFTPVTWQGWVTVVGYIAVVIALIPAFLDAPEQVAAKEAGFYVIFVTVATAGLLLVSLGKGPKPKWRWGGKPGDNPDEDY